MKKAQHLNYCRQMVKQFLHIQATPGDIFSHAITLANVSQKFLLPETGRLYDDPEYRALDESQELNLPYTFIALEYGRATYGNPTAGKLKSTKAIIFARQLDDIISIMPVAWVDNFGKWMPMGEVAIPRTNYLDRGVVNQNGRVSIRVQKSELANFADEDDYNDELGVFLCFLNVLSCRNVYIERSEPSKIKTAMLRNKKSALAFDSYYILTIDTPTQNGGQSHVNCNHRSPREHLRRGHIRRLNDGRRIWVNAAFVGAGRGAGKIVKDYALRANT